VSRPPPDSAWAAAFGNTDGGDWPPVRTSKGSNIQAPRNLPRFLAHCGREITWLAEMGARVAAACDRKERRAGRRPIPEEEDQFFAETADHPWADSFPSVRELLAFFTHRQLLAYREQLGEEMREWSEVIVAHLGKSLQMQFNRRIASDPLRLATMLRRGGEFEREAERLGLNHREALRLAGLTSATPKRARKMAAQALGLSGESSIRKLTRSPRFGVLERLQLDFASRTWLTSATRGVNQSGGKTPPATRSREPSSSILDDDERPAKARARVKPASGSGRRRPGTRAPDDD
jgi:hypothetical protein